MTAVPASATLNVNVGVLGHVDSGKTALCRALSAIGSTAAFDKNPQSQQRGITLDLGFSAFTMPLQAPQHADPNAVAGPTAPSSDGPYSALRKAGYASVQFTLVDCPGHASLVRTIMGGAQIIDIMLLVVDGVHGVQAQTAECLVIGEILGRRLMVAVNKVDQFGTPPEEGSTAWTFTADQRAKLDAAKSDIRAALGHTRWPNAPFFETAAAPFLPNGRAGAVPFGLQQVKEHLLSLVERRVAKDGHFRLALPTPPPPFLFLVDHCFALKGQGTVLTGTVLQGTIKAGDEVEVPDFKVTKRVKSMQMFKKSVVSIGQGDRAGMLLTQFNADNMERGLVCGVPSTAAGAKALPVASSVTEAIVEVSKVRFYKELLRNNERMHLTVGHSTVMGTMRFFSRPVAAQPAKGVAPAPPQGSLFDPTFDFVPLDGLPNAAARIVTTHPNDDASAATTMDTEAALPYEPTASLYYAVVHFDTPVTTFLGATFIASKLDGHSGQLHAPGGGMVHRTADMLLDDFEGVAGSFLNDASASSSSACRLVAFGRLLSMDISLQTVGWTPDFESTSACGVKVVPDPTVLDRIRGHAEPWRFLNAIKWKQRQLVIDKILDATTCVVKYPIAQIAEDNDETTAAGASSGAAKAPAGKGRGKGDKGSGNKKPKAPVVATEVSASVLSRFIGAPVVCFPKELAAQLMGRNADSDDTDRSELVRGVVESFAGNASGRLRVKFSSPVFFQVKVQVKPEGPKAVPGAAAVPALPPSIAGKKLVKKIITPPPPGAKVIVLPSSAAAPKPAPAGETGAAKPTPEVLSETYHNTKQVVVQLLYRKYPWRPFPKK